jgi:hypothetical protein
MRRIGWVRPLQRTLASLAKKAFLDRSAEKSPSMLKKMPSKSNAKAVRPELATKTRLLVTRRFSPMAETRAIREAVFPSRFQTENWRSKVTHWSPSRATSNSPAHSSESDTVRSELEYSNPAAREVL